MIERPAIRMVHIYYQSAIEAGYTSDEIYKVVLKECSSREEKQIAEKLRLTYENDAKFINN